MRLAYWLVLVVVIAAGTGCSASGSSTNNATEASCPGFALYLDAIDGSIPATALARLEHQGIRATPTWEYVLPLARELAARRAVSAFPCRDAGEVRAVAAMIVSGIGGPPRLMVVVYTTGVVQRSFGPGPSNGNPGVEFDVIDPYGRDEGGAI
jgi:hypothetical protein